jgi:phage tail-like protein
MTERPVLKHSFEVSLLESSMSEASALTSVVLGNVIDRPGAGFAECTGLDFRLETDDIEEGGRNDAVLRFPKRIRDAEITLRRGVIKDPELFDWIDSFRRGRGKRRDGVITLRDAAGEPHTVWRFARAIPLHYEGPRLIAAETGVAMESLTLGHEGLTQDPGIGALGEAVFGVAGAIAGAFG